MIEGNQFPEEPEEPTGVPEGFQWESEEEKQSFLEEVQATLSGENDDKSGDEGEDGSDGQQIQIGLIPTGGVGIKVQEKDGGSAVYFVSDPAELWQIAGHLLSLATILVQTHYAVAMKEQQMMEELLKNQTLYVPGHGPIG